MRTIKTDWICPACKHSRMLYEKEIPAIIGGPADNWDPGLPSQMWCPKCGYEPTRTFIIDYEEGNDKEYAR